jgi:predicted nucleic acid-binding protein
MQMSRAMIVLDSSFAISSIYPDEQPPLSAAAVLAEPLIAPSIWVLETANALRSSVLRKRFSSDEARILAGHLDALNVQMKGVGFDQCAAAFDAATWSNLLPYDATYLSLAVMFSCPLATCDAALASAARRSGVTVFS